MSCADSDTDMFVLDHCRCWFRRVWKPLAPGGKALLEYERYCTDAVDDLHDGDLGGGRGACYPPTAISLRRTGYVYL